MFPLQCRSAVKPLPALLILLLAPSVSRAQDLTIKGHVTVAGFASHSRSRESVDTVIWLTPLDVDRDPVAERNPPLGGQYQLIQQGRRFRPHVLVVPVGAVVEFPTTTLSFTTFSRFSTASASIWASMKLAAPRP